MGSGAGLSRGSDPDQINLHPDPHPRFFFGLVTVGVVAALDLCYATQSHQLEPSPLANLFNPDYWEWTWFLDQLD